MAGVLADFLGDFFLVHEKISGNCIFEIPCKRGLSALLHFVNVHALLDGFSKVDFSNSKFALGKRVFFPGENVDPDTAKELASIWLRLEPSGVGGELDCGGETVLSGGSGGSVSGVPISFLFPEILFPFGGCELSPK